MMVFTDHHVTKRIVTAGENEVDTRSPKWLPGERLADLASWSEDFDLMKHIGNSCR